VKLYKISGDLQVTIDTIQHIVLGFGAYIITAFINWIEVYNLICKINMSMQNKSSTINDRKTRDILRETQQKCKYTSTFVIITAIVAMLCDLFDIFILHFVESIFGVEHKYKRNPNAANIYESLLLEKYPFSCWTPFDEKSVTAHIAVYLYTAIPVLMLAFRTGSVASVLLGTMIYISLQFKFVNKSMENLGNMEKSDSLIENKTVNSQDKQNTCEESNSTNTKLPATGGERNKERKKESLQSPSQAQVAECTNKPKHTNTTINTAHCLNEQEPKTDADILPSNNKLSPEASVIAIIKNHQEAIW
jgi:hypothetical protein